MSEFNLEEWVDADLEPYANMQLSQCDRRAMQGRAFHKALDLVMGWIKESDRNFYECNECSFQIRITTFLSQLRGDHED